MDKTEEALRHIYSSKIKWKWIYFQLLPNLLLNTVRYRSNKVQGRPDIPQIKVHQWPLVNNQRCDVRGLPNVSYLHIPKTLSVKADQTLHHIQQATTRNQYKHSGKIIQYKHSGKITLLQPTPEGLGEFFFFFLIFVQLLCKLFLG